VPDWICEVVSSSSARIDRGPKARTYARAGVRHLWIIDPIAQTLEVLRNEEARWVVLAVHSETERVRAEPFEAIELKLGRLWGSE
jgi:Uma2 family endonuclease